jgi:hypothetical protein
MEHLEVDAAIEDVQLDEAPAVEKDFRESSET